ncbi:hypothetical protein [Actinomadura sp. 3N508]|uniref:hypothetical protein n=1 Tax=Actinomadura sp. 3N508 TaxID=3375153 RepID=UPI0037A1BAB8
MRAPAGQGESGWTRHCSVFACDIAAFSGRPNDTQARLRGELYAALEKSFDASDLPWHLCYREDRGDGAIIVPHQEHQPLRLVHPLADHLRGALRWYNKHSTKDARMRLRVALHAGLVRSDDNGIVGDTVNHVARLLDAPAFKREFGSSSAPLGLVVSDPFYREVIQGWPGAVDPGEFRRIEVDVKETRAVGWLHLREPARAGSGGGGLAAADSAFLGRWECRQVNDPGDPYGVIDFRPDERFTFRILRLKDTWSTYSARALLGEISGEWRVGRADPDRPPRLEMRVTDLANPLWSFLRSAGRVIPVLGNRVRNVLDDDELIDYDVVRVTADELEMESTGSGGRTSREIWKRLA